MRRYCSCKFTIFAASEMVTIVIIIITILLLLAFTIAISKNRLNGGYIIPDSFKRSKSQKLDIVKTETAIRTAERFDLFIKALFLRFFYTIGGHIPNTIKYFGGSIRTIDNMREMSQYVIKRCNIEGFLPDFIISNNKNILIIEADENDSYHQDSGDLRYMMKNIAYDEMICEAYDRTNYNICILRIKYKSGGKLLKARNETVKHLVLLTLFTIFKMQRGEYHHQYILCRMENVTSFKITELLTVRPRDYEALRTFTNVKPFYAAYDLDDRTILPKFIKDRSVDDIEVTDFAAEYKASVDNYAGSEYEKYIKDLKLDGEIAGYF